MYGSVIDFAYFKHRDFEKTDIPGEKLIKESTLYIHLIPFRTGLLDRNKLPEDDDREVECKNVEKGIPRDCNFSGA